jgi:hypothetical protein
MPTLWSLIKWCFTGIIPPNEGSPEMRKWMQAVAASIGLWASVVALVTVAAFGVVPQVFEGFARANELEAQQTTLTEILEGQSKARIRALDTQIVLLRTQQCAASQAKNAEVFTFLRDRLVELKREYFDLTRRAYDMPNCDQLLIQQQ